MLAEIFKNQLLEIFMEEQAISFLENLAKSIPLPLFAFLGSIVDELFAPLPSPFVPVTAGTLTYEQGLGFMFLFVVALTGTLGKIISTLLTYWVADKFEDYLTHSKIGKILGVSENEIEKYGRYFNGTRRDDIIMVLLRSLPFIPTLPVSVIAGLIKLNIWTYIWTTFVGTYLRFMFYLIIAYEGVRKYSGVLQILDTTGSIVKVTIVLIIMGWLFLFLRNRWTRIIDFILRKKPVEEIIEEPVKKSVKNKESK